MKTSFKPLENYSSIINTLEMGFDEKITLNVENYNRVIIKNSKNEFVGVADESILEEVLNKGNNIEGFIYGFSKVGATVNNFYFKF